MRAATQRLICSAVVGFLQLAAPSGLRAAEEYRLGPGDTIEMVVAGAPELQRKAQIGADGSISLPLIGRLAVSGQTLSEVQDTLQQNLSTRSIRQRAAGGGETVFAIRPEDVSVDIAQYAPVYILGAVTRPGELSFRPLMTVRQAVSLAGGYEPLQGRGPPSLIEVMELEAESTRLEVEIGRLQLQTARINAELSDRADLDPIDRIVSPKNASALADTYDLERERLKANRAQLAREKEAAATLAENTQKQLTQLAQQRRQQEQLLSQQEAELAEVRDLYRTKVVSLTRVNEAQRGVTTAVERLQQTSLQALQAERSLEELRRQPVKIEDQRRVDLLAGLQEAGTRLREFQARAEALTARLNLLQSSVAGIRQERFNLDIRIFRRGADETSRIDGTEDTLLFPRDLVEVAFERRDPAAATARPTASAPAQAPSPPASPASAPPPQQRTVPNAPARR